MDDVIFSLFCATLTHIVSLKVSWIWNIALTVVGVVSSFVAFRIGLGFGPKISFGKAFTFLGFSFILWTSSLWVNGLLKLIGYFFALMALFYLNLGLKTTRKMEKTWVSILKLAIVLSIPVLYSFLVKRDLYILVLQTFVLINACFILTIIKTKATREFSRGLLSLLVASLLLCVHYLIIPVFEHPLLQILYGTAWFLAGIGLIRIAKDLRLEIFLINELIPK